MIKLSDYIAKRLKEVYKVDRFFMVSGGGAMHLNDSLGRYIPYTACHHEQGCAIAAEGYARVSQKLAVVNVTTGPGGLNALNGVFGQWTDSVPVLYISGQVKYSTCMSSCRDIQLRQLGDQEVDIISVVSPLVKYAKQVSDPYDIKYCLDRAIYEATSGRPGPVWLDIPMNVQAAMIDEEMLTDFPKPNPVKFKYNLEEVLNRLNSAKRPLIIAGHGIRLSGMLEEFRSWLDRTNIPVVTTFNGVDLLPSDHKNFCGRIGTVGQRAGNFTLQNADLILCLGTRNNIRQVSYNWENFAKNAFKIVVDIDKAELDKPLVKPDLKVHADLHDLLPDLMHAWAPAGFQDWLDFCKKIQSRYSFENTPYYQSTSNEINVYDFVHQLTTLLGDDDILVAGNGSACVCGHQTAVVKKNQRVFWNSGDASMGYDLPAALGASYGSDGRRVICLAGDGSVMMNIQELETVAFNHIPLKIFVINNAGYSSIRQTQRNFFSGRMTGSGCDSGVGMPDFNKLAEGFGIKSYKVSDRSKMEQVIKETLNTEGPVVCNVITQKEYAFMPKLSSRVLPDGTMVSASLEDMYPFLPRDEFNANLMIK